VERRQQPSRPHHPERRRIDVEPGFDPAPSQKLDLNEVISRIRQAVAEEHGLQAHAILLLRAGSIAKTSSGKIQRRACRAAYLDQSLLVVGAWHAASGSTSSAASTAAPANTSHRPTTVGV
jgi:hypothetical protein